MALETLEESGRFAEAKGQFNEAEVDYKKMIALAPENLFLHHDLAQLYGEMGRDREEYQEWMVVLRGSPNGRSTDQKSPTILTRFGELSERFGPEQEAQEAYKESIASSSALLGPEFFPTTDPDASIMNLRSDAHYVSGLNYMYQGLRKQANPELKKAIKWNSRSFMAHYALGIVLARKDKLEALREMNKADALAQGEAKIKIQARRHRLGLDTKAQK